MDLNGSPATKGFDGIRINYDESETAVHADIGFDGSKDQFSIHSWAGGAGYTFADISFKTNGTTKMFIESNGNVGIGTTTTSGAKLTVNGTIKAEEIVVTDVGADYVFEDGYKLLSIQEVEAFIKANKHLPNVAPASETEKGIKVGEFNELLLQKMEEMTLYMIDVNKKIEVLEMKNKELQDELNKVKEQK